MRDDVRNIVFGLGLLAAILLTIYGIVIGIVTH